MKRGWGLHEGPEVSQALAGSHFPEIRAFPVTSASRVLGGLGVSVFPGSAGLEAASSEGKG